jgi:hypothetical protein
MACSIKLIPIQDEKEKEIVGVQKVDKRLSKRVTKTDGTVINFIQKDHGVKRGFMKKMNFNIEHPLDKTFCEITIEIERV